MSAAEVVWRISDFARQRTWARYQVLPDVPPTGSARQGYSDGRLSVPSFAARLPAGVIDSMPAETCEDVMAIADRILAGEWTVLGVARKDLDDPDWFLDPSSGLRAPDRQYCFRIDHRSEAVTGNVKQVWEPARMHHLTVLAAAYAISGEDRYARRVADHLKRWWAENPFLSGIHWTSGIELGIRLISWVWIRRLLDCWPEAPALFEKSDDCLRQIWWHQRYLDAFRSRGSSANNHVIAEAAGQLVAALAFDWFPESGGWSDRAAALLEAELENNTFPSGINREMAFEYHGLVAELGFLAAAEADLAGRPLSDRVWQTLCRMTDAVASTVDCTLRAPRHGDSDDGRGLLLGPPNANRWTSLLALGGTVFGPLEWWPRYRSDVVATLVASISACHDGYDRPTHRIAHFDDAGMTILRTPPGAEPEIWCRCDAGPHGYLSIAAHAHADALAVEVRHNGIDILADSGTYCYGSEPSWRSYFRSTLGHNTIELAGRDQSDSGGPTMWMRHTGSRLIVLRYERSGEVNLWSAEHDGYQVLDPPATHRREVTLTGETGTLRFVDHIDTAGRPEIRMTFHLGPEVDAAIASGTVTLQWIDDRGLVQRAILSLDPSLEWSAVKGGVEPMIGWYSPGFGTKVPSWSLVGAGICNGPTALRTELRFGTKGLDP
jgi:hypothetical protein